MIKSNLLNTITSIGRKPVAFEPVTALKDDDELAQALNEPIYKDNQWDLHEGVDAEALTSFWDKAEEDLGAESSADSFTE